MKTRLMLCAGMLAALVALSQADEMSYRDQLVEKYPFYKTAIGAFAPIYPALAKQLVDDYGITEGMCVDLGGGCGSLDMALAKVTNLQFYVLDLSPWAVRMCNLLADENGLTGRMRGIEGDAQNLPFRDNFADLVVSRGSIFFWPDQLAGLKEAYRILKPGGVAYIGGGFSRILDPAVRDKLVADRQKSLQANPNAGGWRPLDAGVLDRAREAGITQIRELPEPGLGWWLEIRK